MEQMTIGTADLRVLPEDDDGRIKITAGRTDSGLIFVHVNEGKEEIALRAAVAGIMAYNADPTFLDPAANKEGPSPRGKATSKAAAIANYPRSGSQRQRILGYFLHGRMGWDLVRERGATREEIEMDLDLDGSSVRPRVLELIAGGWLIETEHTRPTRKGNDSVVLLASQKAVEYRG